MLPENEYYSFENRNYINPQVSLDEQNRFIDNLRNVQAQNNQQISSQTYNLGSALPSNLGGLLGGGGYWKSRYQTPQTNVLVNDLRTVAQSKALTDVLANEQAKMQKRYNAAYRASQIRGSNSNGGGSDKDPDNIDEDKGSTTEVEIKNDPILLNMYKKRLQEYFDAGYPASLAEKKASSDMKSGVNPGSEIPTYSKIEEASYFGKDAYTYTLPNGHKVLVREDTYELVNKGDGTYVLRDKNTGKEFPVGG